MLRAQNLSFQYPQDDRGLPPISLNINPGEITLVTGPSGCGKSTLARCLMGLIPHLYNGELTGEVWLNGYRTDEVHIWQLAEKAGMVFQNPDLQLFNPSVKEEFLYHLPDPDMAHYQELISLLDLERYENTPPLLLSEGEKKRVALGLVLMRQPKHGVLLDEPSLGQDCIHKTTLMQILSALANAGQLIILTTHDLTLAAKADYLILLGKDGIITQGAPQTVFANTSAWQKAGLHLPHWFTREKPNAC